MITELSTEIQELTTEAQITIDYGATYNLGNYENEKINIRITLEPGETLEAAGARARAFVEGMHAETVARRKRAAEIEQAQSRIHDLDYYLKRDRADAREAGLEVSFDAPPPSDDPDELAQLQHQIQVREAERAAITKAMNAHREELRKQREAEWQRERAIQQHIETDGDDEWSGDEGDDSE